MDLTPTTNQYAMTELIRSMQAVLVKLEKANDEWMRRRWSQNAVIAWTEQYGEIVTKTTAAKILSCSPTTVYKLIDGGELKTAPDGRVLVRSMAEWASCQSPNRKAKVQKGISHGKTEKGVHCAAPLSHCPNRGGDPNVDMHTIRKSTP